MGRKQLMLYDLVGVSEERAKEIADFVERAIFFSSADMDVIPRMLIDNAKTKEEAFLMGNLFRYYYNLISETGIIGEDDAKIKESDSE